MMENDDAGQTNQLGDTIPEEVEPLCVKLQDVYHSLVKTESYCNGQMDVITIVPT